MSTVQVLLLAFLWQGTAAIQWVVVTQNGTLVQPCAGSSVIFPWFFTLEGGEDVSDIKWFYTPGGGTPVLMANYMSGQFTSQSPFSSRLRHLTDGGLEMTQVDGGDAGAYTIEVSVNRVTDFSLVRHTVLLQVAEAPSSSGDEELEVVQKQQAEYNNVTGQYNVMLTCGQLTSRGQPPVDAVWTTPSGSNMSSSFYDNGYFYLRLPSPFKGGNYSCRLPAQSAAMLCHPSNAHLLVESSVAVDAVAASLALLEASQQALQDENSRLREDLNDTREKLRESEDRLGEVNGTLTDSISQLGDQLKQYYDKSSTRVSFYAKAGISQTLNVGDTIKFLNVFTNQGGAYDNVTGVFTTPVNGTYFFAFTTSPWTSGQFSNCALRVDYTTVTLAWAKRSDYYDQATGHAVLQLQQGQSVWVSSSGIGFQFEGDLSFFSGFLVSPDW